MPLPWRGPYAERYDGISDTVHATLVAYCTEYRAPPEVAPTTGFMCDEVYAHSSREAQEICDARRPGNEVVCGMKIAEVYYCNECGAKVGTMDDDTKARFQHEPGCNRLFTLGRPEIPDAL